MLLELLKNIWLVFLDTAFWLLAGLLAAGFIKSFISQGTMQRWVGGRGLASVLRAALFGAPLPLCSCGVLPAAIGLRRSGASKEATVSFLISTPETSVDSVAVTYALMGPVMAIFRPIAALINAIATGLLTALVSEDAASHRAEGSSPVSTGCCSSMKTTPAVSGVSSCCASAPGNKENVVASGCCSENKVKGNEQGTVRSGRSGFWRVLSYAGAELLDDISRWMAVGIIIAGLMLTYVPPDWLAQWGSGPGAMLIMLVVGVPMYICAVASTPVAAGFLLAGVSPGAVLVFLLVGPATNIAGFALLRQELGLKVTLIYLAGLSVSSLMMGLLLEWLLYSQQWHIEASLGESHAMMPGLLSWASAIVLIFLAIKPLRRTFLPQLG